MSQPAPIVLEAEIDPREQPVMLAAAQQLSEALRAAASVDWPIRISLHEAGKLGSPAAGAIALVSLLIEAERDEAFDATAARLRARAQLLVDGGVRVLVMTVFRAVPGWRTDPAAAARLERIRRLNRLALDLSHDLGVTVADIDRAFAHIGGRTLGADYRLSGRLAAEVAAHTIVLSLLWLGLDEIVPPAVQDRARAFQGPLSGIDALVRRRLAAA